MKKLIDIISIGLWKAKRRWRKIVAYVVANKVKSIIIASTLAVAVGGTAATITIINNTHTHTPNDAVRENYLEATCKTAGSYDSVVYCGECEEELERTSVTVDATTAVTITL